MKRHYLKLLILSLLMMFVLGTQQAMGEGCLECYEGSIDGYVKDTSGNPIEGARVFAYGYNTGRDKEAYTLESGYYYLGHLVQDEYILSVSKAGYKQKYSTAKVEGGTTTRVDFILEPEQSNY